MTKVDNQKVTEYQKRFESLSTSTLETISEYLETLLTAVNRILGSREWERLKK